MRSLCGLTVLVLGLCLTRAAGALGASSLRVAVGPFGSGVTLRQQVQSVQEIRQEGVTIQQFDYSCGSAGLATLFNSYLRQPVGEREVIDYILRTGDLRKIIQRRAFSLLDLKRFTQSRGAQAEGYSLSFEDLVELGRPVLAPILSPLGHKHFVIFRGIRMGRVYVADPAFGRMTMSRAEFERMWEPRVGLAVWSDQEPAPATYAFQPAKEDDIYVASETAGSLPLRSVLAFVHNPFEF